MEAKPGLKPKRKWTRRKPKKDDLRSRRKKAPKVRKRPVPHRTVLAKRRERMKKVWRENRERLLAACASRRGKLSTRRTGIPDGMRREEAEAKWAEARTQANELFTQMIEQGMVDNTLPNDFEKVVQTDADGKVFELLVPTTDTGKAAVALKEAMVEVLSPLRDKQSKMQAIRTVLEYTKAKPAQKVSAELTKAEDFLTLIAKDLSKDAKPD